MSDSEFLIFFLVGLTGVFFIRGFFLSLDELSNQKKLLEKESDRQQKIDDLYGRGRSKK